MSKTNQSSPQPTYTNQNGPTLQELEILLKRIEELDASWNGDSVKSTDSKQAA